jgi:hypothetical protein
VNGIHPTKDEPDFATAAQLYVNRTGCPTRPKAHRPPSRGELSFLECGSSLPLLRHELVLPKSAEWGICFFLGISLPQPVKSCPTQLRTFRTDSIGSFVRNDKKRVFPRPVQSCRMCLPCNPALAAEGFGSRFSCRLHGGVPVRTSQKPCQATALLNNHVWDKNQCYLRAKRSKSAIWRSISSRAASAADRMPWMRNLNSSAFDARESASSNVINSLV